MFPTTDIGEWGGHGTEGGPWASFFKRYERPLAFYAQRRLRVDADVAAELAARFVARELTRARGGEQPLFRLYDPARGRFRSLLATAFFRYARDELRKEQLRSGIDLDAAPEQEAEDAFCRLVAAEFFAVLRGRLTDQAEGEAAAQVLDLKWPVDGSDPLDNAEIARRTGLTRAQIRTRVARIGEQFVIALRALASQAGLRPDELSPFVGDVCRALDA